MSDLFQQAFRQFFAPIADLLEDASVTEIMINGPRNIWIEKKGKVSKSINQFSDEDALRAALNNIAQSVGRQIDDENPRLDARLPNGYRLHAVIPPCARNGTTVAIRKFSEVNISFKDYIEWGAMTREVAQFLDISMKLGKNILISGGTGSGKTTLLGALCRRIPSGQRVIVIEDASELSIDYEHVVFFETRMEDENGNNEVSIEDLVKSSLRLRPDRIILGEVRGHEALDLIGAMNTGHKGCLGTVHANTPETAVVRLEALSEGGGMSERALKNQLVSALGLVVQVSRYSDGSRRLASIAEVSGVDAAGNYLIHRIFEMGSMLLQADGKLSGELSVTGYVPSFLQEIQDLGISFPESKFHKKAA